VLDRARRDAGRTSRGGLFGSVDTYARAVSRSSPAEVARIFTRANGAYKSGSFESACRAYLDVLRHDPRHLDARNNLALAAMHVGDDLIAQLELEVLRRLSADYVPAAVNLTVVYERLGRRDAARRLAAEAAKMRENVPAANFNLAWYEDLYGNRKEATKLLETLAKLDISDKHDEMLRLVRGATSKSPSGGKPAAKGEDEEAPGFWKKGLAGVCGGKSAWWARILAIIVFLISQAIAIAIAAGIGSAQSDNKGGVGFFAGVAVIGFWYILFWGLPSGGWWWTWAVILTLISSGISAAAAEDM